MTHQFTYAWLPSGLSTQSEQYHEPSGMDVKPTQSMWNHLILHCLTHVVILALNKYALFDDLAEAVQVAVLAVKARHLDLLPLFLPAKPTFWEFA